MTLLQALSARILFVRIKVNTEEKQMIQEAARLKYGAQFSLSNVVREALNLLLDIDLPMVKQGAPVGNQHHAGKRGGNQYTVEREIKINRRCVWCGGRRTKYKLPEFSEI